MRHLSAITIGGLAGLLLLTGAGCVRRTYEIDMAVQEAGVERTLKVGILRDDELTPLPAKEEDALAAAYASAVEHDDQGRTKVTGTFRGRLPDDVGGRGELVRWESSLGSLCVYLERFRGDDDLHRQFNACVARADRAVDLLLAWVKFASAGRDGAGQLLEFVDGEFRRDAQNLALLVWVSRRSDARHTSDADEQQLQARLIQFALDHDYLDLSELPGLQPAQPEDRLHQLCRAIARKLSLEEPAALLPPLESVQAFLHSFNVEFRRSEAWRELAERHRWNPEDNTPPSDLLGQLVFVDVLGSMRSTDQLTVRLRIPHTPLATNGRWDAEGVIQWDTTDLTIPGDPPRSPLPMVNFAVWSQPHPEAQQARFGRILLSDKSLADYVWWRQSISDEAAAEWEEFLSRLVPDKDITRTLDAYRGSLSSDSPLIRGCELLLAAAQQSSS